MKRYIFYNLLIFLCIYILECVSCLIKNIQILPQRFANICDFRNTNSISISPTKHNFILTKFISLPFNVFICFLKTCKPRRILQLLDKDINRYMVVKDNYGFKDYGRDSQPFVQAFFPLTSLQPTSNLPLTILKLSSDKKTEL